MAQLAGSRLSAAIDAEGQVLAWGWNGRGTLGRGHRLARDAVPPQHVLGLENARIVQVALGGWHCLALDDAGQLYAWGGNEYGQVKAPCGGYISLCLGKYCAESTNEIYVYIYTYIHA